MSLHIEQLCKDYPTRSGSLAVLRGISLTLQPGEAVAVMGPSGSGKSTLLYILGTLERPTSGTLKLDGQDPFALPEPQLADFRNRHVGFVFQDHHLLPQCTVLENVLIPTLVSNSAKKSDVEKWAKELLEQGASVTEACFAVGFDSHASFSSLFKRRAGVTPSEYQRRQLERKVEIKAEPFRFIPGCFAAHFAG